MKQKGVPSDVASYLGLAKIQYSVPSGNFGDVLAGFYAKQMGLPIHHFIIATNENDILDRFLKTGRYDKQKKMDGVDPVRQTLSPAMDILISSNFERLLWYLVVNETSILTAASPAEAQKACATINGFMTDLRTKGGFSVTPKTLALARSLFASHRVDNVTTTDAIKRYYHHQFEQEDGEGYILDPHTAVGVVAAEVLVGDSAGGVHTICLATASPGKFPEAVLSAINDNPPSISGQKGFRNVIYGDIAPRALVELDGLPQRMTMVESGGKFERALSGVRKTIEGTLAKSVGKL